MIICKNCKFKNTNGSIFCQDCGERLNYINDRDKKLLNKYVWICDFCGQEFDSKRESDSHEKICKKNSKNTYTSISKKIYKFSVIVWICTLIVFFIIIIGWNFLGDGTYPDWLSTILIIDILIGIVSFLFALLFGTISEFNKNKQKQMLNSSVSIDDTQYLEDKIVKGSSNNSNKTLKRDTSLLIDSINDIIFEPKKKKGKYVWILWVLGIITFFIFLIFWSYSGTNGTNSTSYFNNPSPTPYLNQAVLLSNISIVDYDIKWIGNESYFVGTMKNGNSQHIKDVVIRIDFSYDKAFTKLFDTRYLTVDAVPSKGAFTFQLPLNFYNSKQNWYQFRIESVDLF